MKCNFIQHLQAAWAVMLILIVQPVDLLSQKYFEYSSTAVSAYNEILSLRFQEARETLVHLRISEPDNLIVHSLQNYLDCLGIFIGEEVQTYQKLKDQKSLRLQQIKTHGDRQSPYYLYTQADIHLQWAITRVKFEDYFQAVMEIKRAFNLLKQNDAQFPDFMPNKKNLGLLHALIGTVPDQYRWGLKLLGMSGTIAQGKKEIEEVLSYADRNTFVFKEEAYMMYAYLLLHLENEQEKAWSLIDNSSVDPTTNPLACFVKANVAMKTGRNDLAITILENKPSGKKYFPFPYLHFMEGIARLNRLDSDADVHLKLFLSKTAGIHYIKEAYQKLAWHSLVHGKAYLYERYMQACKSLGSAVIEEDKTALYEARIKHVPDQVLLKARLLFDGGYYKRATECLEEFDLSNNIESKFRLEYYYRMGRLMHVQKKYPEALHYYQLTIEEGAHEAFYFACNAALLSGEIYEKLTEYDNAEAYYLKTLLIKPDQYQASLHQRAKAGLNRLSTLP